MKKIILGLFIALLIFTFPLCVFATETAITEEANSAAEGGMGEVTLRVDVTKNRLKDFKGYDFYVEIKRNDVDSFDPMGDNYYVKSSNDYVNTYNLPYGDYDILSAGVPNDGTGKYGLAPSIESFTLSEKNPTISIDFVFRNFDYSKGEEFSEEEIVQKEDYTEEQNNDSNIATNGEGNSDFVMVIGIFMILVAVVIAFCIFFLVSMKRFKNPDWEMWCFCKEYSKNVLYFVKTDSKI